nr:abscisic acid receptor PYL9-like [Ipomoea batatas]
MTADMMSADRRTDVEDEYIRRHHKHEVRENQCSSCLVKHIRAPVHLFSLYRFDFGSAVTRLQLRLRRMNNCEFSAKSCSSEDVWSLVRRFDQPQRYKPFVSRCIVQGDLEIGSVREVNVKSGLPATTSKERLELLDDDEHIFSMRIVGGDHRLRVVLKLLPESQLLILSHPAFKNMQNYSSIVTVHPEIIDGRPGTLVIESFVVDIPDGNTKDETCYFVEALIKCNLKSLADVSERLAVQGRTEPIDRV